MASYPALELRFARPDDAVLGDLLYAELDQFGPLAIDTDRGQTGVRLGSDWGQTGVRLGSDEGQTGVRPGSNEGQTPYDAGIVWRVFFRDADVRDAARTVLADSFGSRLSSLTALDVDDEDWARRSQAALTSIRVGRIVVSPPWDVPQPDADTGAGSPVNIIIEPSMGFGTGHHATTRLCLQLLQEIDVSGRTVLDVGTGSGVLAIAARMLGAREITALDSDPDALENARVNIARNGVSDAVRVICADLSRYTSAADVILANLTGAVLQRHARELTRLLRPGGWLVVSGFAPDERDPVVIALGAHAERDLVEADWAAVLLGV